LPLPFFLKVKILSKFFLCQLEPCTLHSLMRKKGFHIVFRMFMVLLSLLILNKSIDEIEFQPIFAYSSETQFNDLNSAVEYVAEIVFNLKNQFPDDTKNAHKKHAASFKHINPKFIQQLYVQQYFPKFKLRRSFAFPLDEKYTFLFSKEIIQPPSFL